MFRWLALAALLLLLSSGAFGATRNVKGSCGNNGDGTTSACAGSPGGVGAFNTIQACATAMANGDTCTVFVGTYAEHVTVTAGGVASYKTLTVNPGDTVNVLDFTINSHVKLNGFTITNPSSPNSSPCVSVAALSTDSFITNNTMTACGGGVAAIFEPASTTGTSHVFIQGNTISYTCSTAGAPNVCGGIVVVGNFTLVENNDISHVSYGIRNYGGHNVVRNNKFHDLLGLGVVPTDCGTNSSNCHIDFVEADADTSVHPPSQFHLYENNTILRNTGTNSKGWLLQAENCTAQCFNAIIRFNVGAHIGSGVITDDNSGSTSVAGWSHVKSYNNTWADVNVLANSSGSQTHNIANGSPNGAGINELFYYNVTLVNFNPIGVSGAGSLPYTAKNNLAFCVSNCLAQLHSHIYGSGAWTDDAGNIYADPSFLSYGGDNFHLSSVSSPAFGAGTSLTTVSSGCSGSTTSITVADPDFFSDGFGIAGVQADRIRVGALITSPVVQLSAVNYSTGVLTLAVTISCSNGAQVFVANDSNGNSQLLAASPDIGAFQLVNNPPVPVPTMFSAIPLPGPTAITNVSISPTKSYVSAQGCSQDGLAWNVNCPVKLFCTGCSNSTLVTFDGKPVTGAFKTGEIDVNIPLALLPIPTVATNHTFGLSNPVVAAPVLQ